MREKMSKNALNINEDIEKKTKLNCDYYYSISHPDIRVQRIYFKNEKFCNLFTKIKSRCRT